MNTVTPKVLVLSMYAIDVEPTLPHNRNNRKIHLDYLKHLKESVETLHEIVEKARIEKLLDSALENVCFTIRDLEYVIGTCPKEFNKRVKKDATTPLSRNKLRLLKTYDGESLTAQQFCEKFIRKIRFGNDHFGAIMDYEDYVIGDSVIFKVYYVEGPGYNLFFVGQFFDSDLEVTFRKHSCYVRDVDGVDLLKGSRGSNLYTISVEDMMKSSPICLLSRASKKKSWLWHHRLNHLNFDTINDLARKDLTMLIFYKAPMFLWEETVATACYTQKRSLIHTCYDKTPYELVHGKKPDLTFLCVFGALCCPTNDNEDLGKLKAKQILGFSLVMFPIGRVIESITKEPDESWKQFTSGTPSFTTIDQDAPSTSYSPSSSEVQAPISHQGVVPGPTIKDNPFAQAEDDPFVNVFVPEPSSEESSSGDLRIAVIMEYFVKISKKARILELKRRNMKITVLTTNTPYPSRKILRIYAYTSLKTTKKTISSTPYPGKTNTPYSSHMEIKYYGRYRTIETNLFDYETPLGEKSKEFNYLLKIDPDVLTNDIVGFKTYDEYKDDWNKNVSWVHEKPWTNNGDSELKEEALRDKAIMKGLINEDVKSNNEGWKSWDDFESTNGDRNEWEYENEHGDDERYELCGNETHELPVFNIRRLEMIKYSFGQDEEYVAVKENEYEDLTSTYEDACRAYQEIFYVMDEGWRYVVPTGKVIVLAGRYIVPTGSVIVATGRESKARTTLLQSIPDDYIADFHYMDDARDIWNAVKARFGGNAESKKMRKSMLKQEFSEFRISEAKGFHKGYDRMQKLLSQLNQLDAKPDAEEINLWFLRALPSSWFQVALTLKTKGGLEFFSFDDLYYKLKTLEVDIRGYNTFSLSQSAGPSHTAFVSATSTSKMMPYGDSLNSSSPTTYSVSSISKTGSQKSSNVIKDVLYSFVADTEPEQQLAYEDLEQIDKLDLEEMDLKWQIAMFSVRVHKFEQKDGRKIDFDKKESA
nr:ribonuclease H-like domain-containing protein [Tanacetum cinerariifolium]